MVPVELNDLDRRIWEEELAGFVPARVFDVHTHIYRWAFYTAPDKERGTYRQFVSEPFEEANWQLLDECDRLLLPARQVDFGPLRPQLCRLADRTGRETLVRIAERVVRYILRLRIGCD